MVLLQTCIYALNQIRCTMSWALHIRLDILPVYILHWYYALALRIGTTHWHYALALRIGTGTLRIRICTPHWHWYYAYALLPRNLQGFPYSCIAAKITFKGFLTRALLQRVSLLVHCCIETFKGFLPRALLHREVVVIE